MSEGLSWNLLAVMKVHHLTDRSVSPNNYAPQWAMAQGLRKCDKVMQRRSDTDKE
jgi:hypothetical protein